MEAFLQQLDSLNNNENDEGEEEDGWDDYEFIETLHGLSKNLPSFFGLSDQLMDQILETLFYDVTKIGKYFATEEGKNKVFEMFGIPPEHCSEKLYLLHAEKEDSQYTCPLCHKTVKGIDLFSLICSHFFCRDCWISTVKNGELKCLKSDCNCRMPFIDAHDLYPEIEAEKFKSMIQILTQLDYEMHLLNKGTDYNYCPNCKTKYDLKYARFGCILCRNCQRSFCLKCRKEAHLPLSCHENQEFKNVVSKYKDQNKELNMYKKFRNLKIRLVQQKKEIQQIVQFLIKNNIQNKQKIDDILNQNITNTRKIYELIKDLAKDDFNNFEYLNDQEFLNNILSIQFKEKYANQFPNFLNTYQSIIKSEEEAKAHFSEISGVIDKFDSDTSLHPYLYDLSIIFGFSQPPDEIVYEEPYIDPEFQIDFGDDADDEKEVSNGNENAADSNQDSNLNNNDNDNDNSNENDNATDSNQNSNLNNNDNDNDNSNENSNDNDNSEKEEERKKQEELANKQKLYEENPYKEALDAYMEFYKSALGGQMPQYKIENDPEAVEFSINKNFVKIIKGYSKAFLHFHRKSKNFQYILILLDNIDRFLYQSDENFQYDLAYYLILLRFFSCINDS